MNEFEPNEYERAFVEESIEKKRIASGARHKTSSRTGSIGVVRTPIDYLTGKARQEYIQKNSGKVTVSFMYDYIETKEEFLALESDDRRKYLLHYLNDAGFTKKQLESKLGARVNFINDQLRSLGIKDDVPKDKKNGQRIMPRKKHEVKESKVMPKEEIKPTNNVNPMNYEQDVQVFVRTLTGEQIQEKIMSKITALDKSAKYFINLQITELIDRKKPTEKTEEVQKAEE